MSHRASRSSLEFQAVIQEEVTGCGIAVCAVLARISYAEARERALKLGIDAADSRLWSDTSSVRRLLYELGIDCAEEESPFSTWEELPDTALLAIKWHLEKGKPFWHWVVFSRTASDGVVLDSKASLKHHPRRDFGRIKPKWFIPINFNLQ